MSDPESRLKGARPLFRARDASRVTVVAVLAAALIVGGLIDRVPAPAPAAEAGPVAPVPVAAPAGALSSSWFCAGATDNHSGGSANRGLAPGAVVIANAGATEVSGAVTLVPSVGPQVRIPVTVGPDGRRVVAENVRRGAPWIGAIVDIDAGAVAVDEQVTGPLGEASTPCATSGSSQWYFATGATLVNASVRLALLNPYATDAIVDLSFTTNEGFESPQPFQGLNVPAGGLVEVNLGDHLRRRQFIATTVTARSGRLVAWKTDLITPPSRGEVLLGTPAAANPLADPAAPIAGVTVTLGVPDSATTWTWPEGSTGNGVNEQYVIYNPGVGTAQLELSVDLDQGVAEPFDVSVGPEQVATIVSSQEARIPPGVGHAAILQSQNSVPVVAERVVAAAPPSAWSGLGELPGGQVAAGRWLLPAAQADHTHDGWVVLYNPASTPIRAGIDELSAGRARPVSTVVVPGGRRAAIHLNQPQPMTDVPLVVSTSGAVYVELDVYGANGTPGIAMSFGVPLGHPTTP